MINKMSEEVKNIVALLNGIARRTYFKETEITDDYLKSQIYPDMTDDDFQKLVTRLSGLIRNMVSSDMDLNQFEAFIIPQTKRKEGALTEDQVTALRKFWKSQKNKIHNILINNSTWNSQLKKVSWRIDVKSQSRNIDQINTPSAILELQLEDESKKADIVRFEMDEEKLTGLLQSMKNIENEIQKYSQQ